MFNDDLDASHYLYINKVYRPIDYMYPYA